MREMRGGGGHVSKTTVVGTRVSVVTLARLYRWLRETGQYTKASPGGVTRRALEVLDFLLFSKGIGHDIVDEEYAEVLLGSIMMTGLKWEAEKPKGGALAGIGDGIEGLSRTNRGAGKQNVSEEVMAEVLRRFNEDYPISDESTSPEELNRRQAARDAAQIAAQRAASEEAIKHRKSMVLTGSHTDTVEEWNAAHPEDLITQEDLDLEALRRLNVEADKVKRNMAARKKVEEDNARQVAERAKAKREGRTGREPLKAQAGEDEFGEFAKVADEIAAKQEYVLDVQPAEAAPGVVETQEELRADAQRCTKD
jgi:hypothetical protein